MNPIVDLKTLNALEALAVQAIETVNKLRDSYDQIRESGYYFVRWANTGEQEVAYYSKAARLWTRLGTTLRYPDGHFAEINETRLIPTNE